MMTLKLHEIEKSRLFISGKLIIPTSFYGRNEENLDKLLKYKLIDFVGSDIHNLNHIVAFKNKVKIGNIKDLKRRLKIIHFS